MSGRPDEKNFTDFLIHEWADDGTRCGITKEQWLSMSSEVKQWAHTHPAYTTCPDCISAVEHQFPTLVEAFREAREKARANAG